MCIFLTNSGEMLNPTSIDSETFFLCHQENDDGDFEDVCYSISEYDISNNDPTIKDKKEAVCIYSNRSKYYSFDNHTIELDDD